MAVKIQYSKIFLKHFRVRIMPQKSLARQFDKRLQLFLSNHTHSQLRDHTLTGSMQGKRAFSVTGDYRVVYRQISETEIEFLDVGTHAQVYS